MLPSVLRGSLTIGYPPVTGEPPGFSLFSSPSVWEVHEKRCPFSKRGFHGGNNLGELLISSWFRPCLRHAEHQWDRPNWKHSWRDLCSLKKCISGKWPISLVVMSRVYKMMQLGVLKSSQPKCATLQISQQNVSTVAGLSSQLLHALVLSNQSSECCVLLGRLQCWPNEVQHNGTSLRM